MSSKILTALFLVGGASALYAAPVYSCGGGSACNGNLYAVWVVSQTATSYVLDVGVQVTKDYLTNFGGPGGLSDSINGLAITPDNQSSFTTASLTGTPSSGTWTSQSSGLNVSAGATGTGSHLFSLSGSTVMPNLLVWQFTITGTPPSLGDAAHLSYNYVGLSGNQVGSSGSFDVAIQCDSCVGPSDIGEFDAAAAPEPMTSALVGIGLIGLYFVRRRLPGSR